jgi:putative membrane protein
MVSILSMLTLSLVSLGLFIWLIPGIEITSVPYAVLALLIISLINTFLRPLVKVIGAHFNPIAIVIFSLILNVLLFCLLGFFDFGIFFLELPHALTIALIYSVFMTLLSFVMYKK